jgi:acetyl-CoA carboxylase carboxyltransferase component
MAHEYQVPIVRLVDGTGGGGSVRTLKNTGRTYIPGNPAWEHLTNALAEIPVVAAALGSVAGIGAARVSASHFSVMVKDISQVFVAGPPVVAAGMGYEIAKEQLGGSDIHAHGSGAVDNEAETEEEAFNIEDIIDARATRPMLCDWVENAYAIEATRLGVKRRGMRV